MSPPAGLPPLSFAIVAFGAKPTWIVGTGSAYIYSVFATVAPNVFVERGLAPDVYYEAVVLIIALILSGNWLEARAKKRTAAAITALVGLAPKTARVVRDGVEIDVPLESVAVGDLVRVRPGEKVPVDGVVVEGATTVDETLMAAFPGDPINDDLGELARQAMISRTADNEITVS